MELSRARLLYVITSSGIGGSEKVLADLALAQRPRCAAVAVCTLKPPGAVALELQRQGIEVFTCNLKEGAGPAGALDTLRALWPLGRAVCRFRPTLLHAFLFRAGLMARLPVVLHRVPRLVVSIRQMNWRSPLVHRFNHLTSGVVDRFTAVSAAVRSLAVARSRIPAERIEVIPNGVEVSGPGMDMAHAPHANDGFIAWRRGRRDRARRHLATLIGPVSDDLFLVGSVGRLHPVKSHVVLLEALSLLAGTAEAGGAWIGGRWATVIVGEGSERPALQARAARPPLAGHAWLLGERADVREILPAFDLFVLPSQTEGMSNALLEAMAEGIPAIATDTGGNPEVIEHDASGLLVQRGQPAALAAAIGSLTGDPARAAALGLAGRERVQRHFSRAAMLRAYEGLYRDLLAPL